MKKFLPYILILVALVGLFGSVKITQAQEKKTCYLSPGTAYRDFSSLSDTTKERCDELGGMWGDPPAPASAPAPTPTDTSTTYTPLAPLPGFATTIDTDPHCNYDKDGKIIKCDNPCVFGTYLNTIIDLVIGFASVLAVVMIVIGGIEYITSDIPSAKGNGKERIINAIFGLVLVLGAYALLNTINPALLDVCLDDKLQEARITIMEEQLKQYSGRGVCEPVADLNNPCRPDKLKAAGFASGEEASSICNGESKGVDDLHSGVDRCADDKAFSFGLFQINIIAHANGIPNNICSNIFQINGGDTQGDCLEYEGKICVKRNCEVKDSAKYQTCINYITRPENNIAYAVTLQKKEGWEPWGAYNSCRKIF